MRQHLDRHAGVKTASGTNEPAADELADQICPSIILHFPETWQATVRQSPFAPNHLCDTLFCELARGAYWRKPKHQPTPRIFTCLPPHQLGGSQPRALNSYHPLAAGLWVPETAAHRPRPPPGLLAALGDERRCQTFSAALARNSASVRRRRAFRLADWDFGRAPASKPAAASPAAPWEAPAASAPRVAPPELAAASVAWATPERLVAAAATRMAVAACCAKAPCPLSASEAAAQAARSKGTHHGRGPSNWGSSKIVGKAGRCMLEELCGAAECLGRPCPPILPRGCPSTSQAAPREGKGVGVSPACLQRRGASLA